ncbi:Mediator complex subunit Med14 [Lasiodiplodia theobromae]|nr:Mediator complex subunit Med14 [Lasiodiplodia theobromae]
MLLERVRATWRRQFRVCWQPFRRHAGRNLIVRTTRGGEERSSAAKTGCEKAGRIGAPRRAALTTSASSLAFFSSTPPQGAHAVHTNASPPTALTPSPLHLNAPRAPAASLHPAGRGTKPPHGLHLSAPLRVASAACLPHSSAPAPRSRTQVIAASTQPLAQFSKIPLAERKAEDGLEGVQGSYGDGADGAKGRSMPGIVSMDRNGAQGASLGKLEDRALAASAAAHSKLNGDVPLPHVDRPSDMNGKAITNGAASLSQSPAANHSQLPPELTHFTEFYMPFGKLVERVAQETNVSLGELLDKMSNLQVSPAPVMNGINGHAMNGATPQSRDNEEKKTLMLNWAWGEREKFIKLLVLSKWSRNCDDVSKMIDLNAWLTEQMNHYEEAPKWIGQLKLNMDPAKAPNPDLKTALEVLSTGKAPWMPDQMLKTVTNLNALLAIRINLHEELPRHMKDWSIASGRATFRVPSEFELDVSIADEDPASPFFIVDVRFLFTPKPEVPDGWFREWVEPEANTVLASSGLSGIYDWLHGFVLTHKLTTLKMQAYELAQTSWANSIHVQQVHRSLTVQYWTGTSGAKSWIEIGISSGKSKDGKVSWRGPSPPQLSLRWTRKGVPVENIPIEIDWTDLSLERILKAIIALHISFILDSIRDQLSTLSEKRSGLSMEAITSTTEPADCCLRLLPGRMAKATEVRIDPISGGLSLRPVTPFSLHLERDIRDIATEAAPRIESLICNDLRNRVDKEANNAGWTKLRHVNIRPDATSEAVNQKVVAQSFYRCQNWNSKWVLGLTVNLDGENWWLVELSNESIGNSILEVIPLMGTSPSERRHPLSYQFLRAVEEFASAQFTFAIAVKELRRMHVPHVLRILRNQKRKKYPTDHPTTQITPALYIKSGPLLGEKEGHNSWAGDILRLHHKGLDTKTGTIIHAVKGQMSQGHVDFNLVSSQAGDVSFNSDGTFEVRLRTPFGEPFLEKIINRLKRIERLGRIVDVAKDQKLHCSHISLSRVVFRYCGNYKADIRFPEGSPVELHISPNNPHRRVAAFLRNVLNDRDSSKSFPYFMKILSQTVPLLRGFESMENSAPAPASIPQPYINPRSLDWYRLSYENPLTTFDIRLRTRHDAMEWHIHDSSNQQAHPRSPEFAAAMKEFLRQSGEKWIGVRTGIVARIDGVEEALKKLDEIVKKHQKPVVDRPVGGTAAAAQQPPGPTQQNSQQNKPQAQGQAKLPNQQPAVKPDPEVIMLD